MSSLTPEIIVVQESSDRLEITPSRYKEWFSHAIISGEIYWDREGDVRIITCTVIKNALRAFSDYTQLVSAGRLHVVPEGACYIDWQQTILAKDRFKGSDESSQTDNDGEPPSEAIDLTLG